MSQNEQSVLERFQMALDLFELSERMLRQKVRRQHPTASDEDVESRARAWLHHRPGAEHGDAEGRPIELPRSSS